MRPDGPLVTRPGALCGAWTCLLTAVTFADGLWSNRSSPGLGGLFNDFADYWAAARILDQGGDPYDTRLVSHVLDQAGMHTLVGTGYSYPLLLAELLRPLGLLPPLVAGALFTAASLACLWLAMALLLSPLAGASRVPALAIATAAGLSAPIGGSLYVGQVNLVLLAPLALAFRGAAGPAGLAIAAAVKLYPAAAALAFGTAGRRGLRQLALTGGATVALALGPNLVTGRWSYGSSLLAMFGRDPFWTNQSLNGWLSRLAPPDLPVTPLMVAIAAALGALTLAVVARQSKGWPAAFALLLWYGVVAAPKNSLWNFAPLLVVGVSTWTLVRGRPAATLLLVLSWALIDGLWPAGALLGSTPAAAWATSAPLYGALLLGGVLSWALLRQPRHEHHLSHATAGPGDSRR